MKSSTNLFSILCLSSATGLSLYWLMFLMSSVPRMVRYGLGTPEMYASTGIIGAVCVALFALGIVSFRAKPAKTLVLVRNGEGRVVSINEAEYGRVARGKASAPKAKPIQASQARKQGKAKHVIGVTVLAALVLGGYASMMVMMGYTPQDLMSGMCSPFMVISSQSMQPVLNYGDLIIVRREPSERIEVGNIIAFNVPSPHDKLAPSPTVHRVVEKWTESGESYFKTMGDNNQGKDPWTVSGKNVIGKYAGKIPYLGLVVLFLRSTPGLALTATAIALSSLYSYFTKKESKKP